MEQNMYKSQFLSLGSMPHGSIVSVRLGESTQSVGQPAH